MVAHTSGGIRSEIARAVVPQGDVVEVLDVQRALDSRGASGRGPPCGIVDNVGDAGGEVDVGGVDGDVAGIRSEEVEVIEGAVILVRAAESHDNEADKGGDGQGHGREDTRKATELPHDGGGAWLTRLGGNEGRVGFSKGETCVLPCVLHECTVGEYS